MSHKILTRIPKFFNFNRIFHYIQTRKSTSCTTASKICQVQQTCNKPKVESMMDLLPVPQGCWQDQYNKNNLKYNIDLILGIVNLITVLICYSKIGILPGYPEVGPLEKVWEYFETKK